VALELTGKTITDPLYGNINLTELESRLVSTRAFQRLHNVRQLGLGHLVFPSAAYSRFSHSVGTCHNADRILTAIETNQSARRFSDEERQAFRIAALFHDLGHYPFSHTTEHAIKRFFRDGIYKRTGAGDDQGELAIETEPGTPPAYLDHEDTGKLIFLEDSEIDAAFKAAGRISKSDVQSVFLDEKLSTVISSDLDCDRLDYLKRTALHSGAPYGAVDVDFIISKATVDNGGRFCFGRKAIRASDHLLVSRFYDFMQIPYQKTVAALEWSLEEAVIHLLRHRVLVLSEADMLEKIRDGRWPEFDDGALLALMRNELRERSGGGSDEIALDHLAAVLHRKPAKMIYNWECLVDFLSTEQETREQLLEYKLRDAAQRLGLDRRRFTIWKAPFKLSKAGPMLQGSPEDRDYSDEEQQQLIHVLDKGGTSVPLIDLPSAVSHHLAKVRYRVLRVYYLPRGSDFPDAIGQLREALAD
jgi:HD superfamily phosphohydrolase